MLNLSLSDNFKPLLKAVETAFKMLHKKGTYKPEDLEIPEYKKIIRSTAKVLNDTLKDNQLSNELIKRLENDIFLFSSLKTHAQLFEASRLLLTEEKTIKSFSQFSNDVSKIKKNYNENYLEAEYDFAVGAVQMAERWESFEDGDKYYLQYRTASDDRVRDSHRVLHDITLPKNDPFWDSYFAPNGWRCRCTVVQVLSYLNDKSDPKKAMELGEKATTKLGKKGENKLAIFRFNAAKQKVIFPPKHPYNKVVGAKAVKATVKKQISEKAAKDKEIKYLPENIDAYEKKFKTKINREFFKLLKNEVKLVFEDGKVDKRGAYYSPSKKIVNIPVTDRSKRSKGYSKRIIYHEFGHAIDWSRNLRDGIEVKNLMKKYRQEFKKDKNKRYGEIHSEIFKELSNARIAKDFDKVEDLTATADTLMSLNPRFGGGHSKAYFRTVGLKEAEFIAHAFENAYKGNDSFKQVMPELYKDTIKYIEDLKPIKE